MDIAPEILRKHRPEMNMGLQKLLVNAAAEKGRHGNIKFCRIHVIDQVHQHLLGTSLSKIMDEEKNFYH